jgi:hypothetical protein
VPSCQRITQRPASFLLDLEEWQRGKPSALEDPHPVASSIGVAERSIRGIPATTANFKESDQEEA